MTFSITDHLEALATATPDELPMPFVPEHDEDEVYEQLVTSAHEAESLWPVDAFMDDPVRHDPKALPRCCHCIQYHRD